MSKAVNRKDQILKTTKSLLQKYSYNYVSFQQIADQLGIKKASLYYYFPSKAALGLTVLQEYRSNIKKIVTDYDAIEQNPSKKLESYFWFFKRILNSGDNICLAGIMSAEYHTFDHNIKKNDKDNETDLAIQVELKEMFEEHFTWLTKLLKDGRQSGEFQFNGTASNKAMLIESTVQGAMLLSRMLGKTEHYLNVTKQIKTDLGVITNQKGS